MASLDVYLSQDHVGKLYRPGSGRLAFEYDQSVVETSLGQPILSTSLPVQAGRFPNGQTRPFFEGLLPEGSVREQVARERKISVQNSFGLLAELGSECAGAVIVIPEDQPLAPTDGTAVRWLTDEELADALNNLPLHPLGGGTDVRVSLGGVQEKLVVTRAPSGRFGQPLGGAPSTHIIKPSGAAWTDIATNEAFCLRVAHGCGLSAATSEIATIGETSCLIVQRFDRTLADDLHIARLHQEDFCQALGVLPSSKYESEGGPSIAAITEVLRNLSAAPAADVNAFLDAVVLNFLMGNSDAHGKNFALLHQANPADGVRLAPLYDIVSTAVYDVTPNMAMSIGGLEQPGLVNGHAWRRLCEECGVNAPLFLRRVRDLAVIGRECAAATAAAARAEGWYRPVIDEILDVAQIRSEMLLDV